MHDAFGPGVRRLEIVQRLSAVRDAAVGVGLGQKAAILRERIEAFAGVQYDDALKAAEALNTEADALALLPYYARGRTAAVAAGRDLASTARAFLDNLALELRTLEEQFAGTASSAPADIKAITESLDVIQRELTEGSL
jgi:hypothetical protein